MAEVNAPQKPNPDASKFDSEEELTYDSSAYHLYHAMQTGIPCLTFDILPHPSNSAGLHYPLSLYLIGGLYTSLNCAGLYGLL